MSAGRSKEKLLAHPMRRATWLMIHQSGFASPGRANSGRWRLINRSELVTVPSFSPQPAAGRRTWAKAAVAGAAVQTEQTGSGQALRGRGGSVGIRDAIGDNNERAEGEGVADRSGIGHADGGIGRHDPDGLDLAVPHAAEHVDRLEPRLPSHFGR